MKFGLVNSQPVYRGKVFDIRVDRVRLPDGKLADLDIVEHPGAVTLLPVDEQNRIWFVRQYRHAAGLELLELPAGALDPDERPEEGARREVREEIGMSAGQLEEIGSFFLAPGYSTEYMHVFLARGLQEDPLEADEDEFLSIEKIPIGQAYRMVERGEIQDAKSLAALLLARSRL